jgi:hypothetical protein
MAIGTIAATLKDVCDYSFVRIAVNDGRVSHSTLNLAIAATLYCSRFFRCSLVQL